MLEAAVTDSRVKLDDYVERRLAWVRAGDPTPMDIPMSDGSVLRSQLATLPGGGRMLIFSDVTDIVRAAEEMKRLATIDGMTGIYNRRHFLLLADHEWKRAQRSRRPVAFLMIDIDHFKEINDNFGHEAGDRVIVHLANLARDCKRESDVLARIGGEEFALLLPETTLDQAMMVAERLRQQVLKQPSDRNVPCDLRERQHRCGGRRRSHARCIGPHEGRRPGALLRQTRRSQPRALQRRGRRRSAPAGRCREGDRIAGRAAAAVGRIARPIGRALVVFPATAEPDRTADAGRGVPRRGRFARERGA